MGENPRCYRSPSRSPTSRPLASACSPPPGDISTPAFKIEEQLNGVYEKRIAEINQQAEGDARLKEVTYVEWISMLRQVNKTLINNIQDMERETSERLALLQRKVGANCRFSQDSELNKYRNDIAGLIQLIRNGRLNDDWNVDKFQFETITERDIFGNDACYCDPSMNSKTDDSTVACIPDSKVAIDCQKAKLTAHVKALAFEVAEKHDEIRDLKKQIMSMEDEIQKAQGKIQLKEDVIKELRNDLKSLPKCNNLWGLRFVERAQPTNPCTPKMSIKSTESYGTDVSGICRPTESYSNRESINSMNCGSEHAYTINLPDEEDEEEEFMKCLKEELCQFFEMRRTYDQNVDEQRRAIKEQQDRLSDMVDKLLKSNFDFQTRLKFYRRELLVLENPHSSRTLTTSSDVDSGICSDSDVDVKILNSVRGRFGGLIEENHRLKKEEQCMQIKYEDANCRAIAKSDLLEKTSKALREVADVLTNELCQPIAYDKLFGDCQDMSVNPIVEAVDELISTLKEKDKTICELRNQITNTGKANLELECCSEQLRTELCELKQTMSGHSQVDCGAKLVQNEEFSKRLLKKAEKYQEENSGREQENQSEYLRIIDDLSSELNTLSRQVNMVQKDFLTDEVAKQFESSLKGLETQNDLLQSAVESLIQERETIERTLKAQNEELKNRLCAQEDELYDLQNELCQLKQRPCHICGNRGQDARNSQREERRADSVEELQKLEHELRRRSKTVECLKDENARLNEELVETKRNQAKMKLIQRRGMMSAIEGQKASDDELINRLSAAEAQVREKTKCFQKAIKEVACLQQEVDLLRCQEESFSKERELLQIELIALKETQAEQMGKQVSLQEQLQGTITELYAAKERLQDTLHLKDRFDCLHREEIKRFQELKADMFQKYNNLVEDYNNVLKEYQKVVQIEQEQCNQIRAFNAWKEEQLQSEREVCRKMQMYEQHLKDMLQDKQNLLDKLHDSEADNRTLLQVIERSSLGQKCNQSKSSCSPSRSYAVSASVSADPVCKVIENVRSASRRLTQQRSILQDEACRLFSQPN